MASNKRVKNQLRLWRTLAVKYLGGKCKICNSTKKLEIHHIDGNPTNNALSNLTVLCFRHHRRKDPDGPPPLRIYVINHSKTHRDKYVHTDDGEYICFSCNKPPYMDCGSKIRLSFKELTQIGAYNRAATDNEKLLVRQALEVLKNS